MNRYDMCLRGLSVKSVLLAFINIAIHQQNNYYDISSITKSPTFSVCIIIRNNILKYLFNTNFTNYS